MKFSVLSFLLLFLLLPTARAEKIHVIAGEFRLVENGGNEPKREPHRKVQEPRD